MIARTARFPPLALALELAHVARPWLWEWRAALQWTAIGYLAGVELLVDRAAETLINLP